MANRKYTAKKVYNNAKLLKAIGKPEVKFFLHGVNGNTSAVVLNN